MKSGSKLTNIYVFLFHFLMYLIKLIVPNFLITNIIRNQNFEVPIFVKINA